MPQSGHRDETEELGVVGRELPRTAATRGVPIAVTKGRTSSVIVEALLHWKVGWSAKRAAQCVISLQLLMIVSAS